MSLHTEVVQSSSGSEEIPPEERQAGRFPKVLNTILFFKLCNLHLFNEQKF